MTTRPLKRNRWLIVGAVALLALVLQQIYPVVWYSPAIEGVVIDAATNEPVSGAIVSVTWQLTGPLGPISEYVAAKESTTNNAGRYKIPAWGPRFRFSFGYIPFSEPSMLVLRRGYFPLRYYNDLPRPRRLRDGVVVIRKFWLNHETLDLNPITSDIASYDEAIEFLDASLQFEPFSPIGNNCYWDQIPLTFSELAASATWLARRGYGQQLSKAYSYRDRSTCNSFEYVLGRFLR